VAEIDKEKIFQAIKEKMKPGAGTPVEMESMNDEELFEFKKLLEKDQTSKGRIPDLNIQNVRSHEVQEILGYIPNWIVRWGITVLFATVLVLLVGSWFFRYPDVIASTVVVTSTNPPAALLSRSSGKIQHLFVTDTQKVEKNSVAAVIENAADYHQVFTLRGQLETLRSVLKNADLTRLKRIQFNRDYTLGELQAGYETLLKGYFDFKNFLDMDFNKKKLIALGKQLAMHKLSISGQEAQLKLLEADHAICRQQFERAQIMFKEGYFSRNDFDAAESAFIQKQYSFEGAKSNLVNSRIQTLQLEQSIRELQLQDLQESNDHILELKQSCENMLGQIAQWEQNYVLKCPISGVASLAKYWSVNQNVKAGDVVLTVISEKKGKIVGKVVLPVQGSGKVKPGQPVNVKFDNFPYQEYGMVRGVVVAKSLVPSEDSYTVEIGFPEGLKSNYKKILKFDEGMKGSAEIITENIPLLLRLLQPLKMILRSSF